MSSGRYLNLRGRGSSFDRSRLARRMANLDTKDIGGAYKMHEQIKKLKYEQRIREVEHATFNPLVFCTGGAGHPRQR